MKKRAHYSFYFFFLAGSVWSGSLEPLQNAMDARSLALGGIAVSEFDAGSFQANPAALAGWTGDALLFTGNRWIQGLHIYQAQFAHVRQRGGFGLSIHFSEIGDIEHRLVPGPSLGVFSASDAALSAGYARMLTSRLAVGATARVYYERIYIHEAWAIGGDLGLLWRSPVTGLDLGASIQHLGWAGKLQQERLDLPMSVRFGFKYHLSGRAPAKWGISGTLLKQREHSNVYGGMEWAPNDLIALRIGYITGMDTRGIAAGVGLNWNRFRLDYGFSPFREGLGDVHSVTVRLFLS